jgi:threonylcarbamoyladenosine tRNA methylthiotransferase MtaB
MQELKSVAFHTLGCKLNYAETSTISRLLQHEGFVKKDFDDKADVYVINTCSVTENADKECRQLVRRIQRKSPASIVVITGCYAQLKPKEIAAIPGVDLILGASEKFEIARHLKELTKGESSKICSCDIEEVNDFVASYSFADRTRTFLKIQDGCNYNCSFCTIPLARGKSRSDSINHVLDNANELANSGVKEIVLTGVNLGDFGNKDQSFTDSRREDLLDLITKLDDIDGIHRFRLSSIEPNLLSNSIIEFVASSNKFMPHFHIPLQSGSNKVLGQMRRRYKKELYAEKVSYIKSLIPHCGIGVDVIVGFAGETEKDFQETYDFLQALEISYLHVFTYSERDDTSALDIRPVVPINERHIRNKILRNLSYEKLQHFRHLHHGQTRKVLFESPNKNKMMEGYTDNYIKIVAPFQERFANNIVEWLVD